MKQSLTFPIKMFFTLAALSLLLAGCQSAGEEAATADKQQSTAQGPANNATAVAQTEGNIQWMSMKQALAIQQQSPRPIFIDVYTDWCGWCKVMDKKTFSQPEVAEYMNENFYPVKFNAEKDEPLTINGQEYKVVPAGRRNIHTLAYAMLDGQMSYPAFVVLNSNLQRAGILKGYKEPQAFLQELEQMPLQ